MDDTGSIINPEGGKICDTKVKLVCDITTKDILQIGCCHFCGAYGVIVDKFHRRGYKINNNKLLA